jgi:hypothetical protein
VNDAFLSSNAASLAALSGESVTYYKRGAAASGVVVQAKVFRNKPGEIGEGGRVLEAAVLLPRSVVTDMPTNSDEIKVVLRPGDDARTCRVVDVEYSHSGFWHCEVQA